MKEDEDAQYLLPKSASEVERATRGLYRSQNHDVHKQMGVDRVTDSIGGEEGCWSSMDQDEVVRQLGARTR